MPNTFEHMISLIERHGIVGFWSWRFEREEHFWSPGCFDLLGFGRSDVAPSYGRIVQLVHPYDRPKMPRLADLMRGEPIPSQTVQVIRRDGTTRLVSALFEVRVTSDGRPSSACGVLMDVTDREWLIRSRTSAIRRRRLLDSQAGVLRFTVGRDRSFDFVPEAAELVGRPLSEVNADPFAVLCPDGGREMHDLVSRHLTRGADLVWEFAIAGPDATPGTALLVMTPVRGERGEPDTWDGLLQIRGALNLSEGTASADPIGRVTKGGDFAAARAMIGWSRQDLADASGLSLSTVRRVEEDDEASSDRSRTKLIEALRRGGARFQPTVDGSVAISRRPEPGRPGEAP